MFALRYFLVRFFRGGYFPPSSAGALVLSAYATDYVDVSPVQRFSEVPAVGLFIDVPPVHRVSEVR